MNPSAALDACLSTLGRRPRLLIVDDQPSNIRLLHELFRTDCDVFMATTGEQAIKLCLKQSPDLVILDIVMKGMSGHEVCRQLKADSRTSEIPVIFVTGLNKESDEAYGFEIGAVDFISKPINPVIVKARVRTHLALKLQSDILRSIALRDGLTGVGNRRKFDEDLQAAWWHCKRERESLSLIMLDVDFFKRYNDRYGHHAGDECLISIAQKIKFGLSRPYDAIARYGGEEFACLLPETDAEGAKLVAEKLLGLVRELAIEHGDSDVAQVVTVSLGVATIVPADGLDPKVLIESADQELYRSKRAGRNRASSTVIS